MPVFIPQNPQKSPLSDEALECDNGEEEEEQAVVGLEAEEEQPGTEVEDAAMVMQAFGVTSLVGVSRFLCVFVCIQV